MKPLSDVPRSALEHFAERVIAEHRATRHGLCGSCHQWSPCPVERAAIVDGLAYPPLIFNMATLSPWRVSGDADRVTCETDWRDHGQGRIVTFDRTALEAGGPLGEGPWDLTTRSAWAAARRWIVEQERTDGDG